MRKITFLLLLLTIFYSCRTDRSEALSNESFAATYLVEHSPPVISTSDQLIFIFKNTDHFTIDTEAIKGVSISPHIAGKWIWNGTRTLQFTPSENWKYDQDYVLSIDMAKLSGNNSENKKVEWKFSIRPLRYSIDIQGVRISSDTKDETITISGSIESSDRCDDNMIESMLMAKQDGHTVPVRWIHESSGRVHQFEIVNIEQYDHEESKVSIRWDGTNQDPTFKGGEAIKIAKKNDFAVEQVRLSSGANQHIEVSFSRPLQPDQNLSGLVSLGEERKFQTEIDGNILLIYPRFQTSGIVPVELASHIKSTNGMTLPSVYTADVRFDLASPEARFIGNGGILPFSEDGILPIEVVNLKALRIEVYKIYQDNVLQFLQGNSLNDGHYLKEVGRLVHREKIEVTTSDKYHNQWRRVGIHLRDYVSADPGAIYQIRVGFAKVDAITNCSAQGNEPLWWRNTGIASMMDYYEDYYARYDLRNDPCADAYYYPERFLRRNVLLSDIGAVVKKATDNRYYFAVSSLSTGEPISNARVQLFDYQQQLLEELQASNEGFLRTSTSRKAAFAVISHAEKGYVYLDLRDQNSNSFTEFDVSGVKNTTGTQVFMYSDRGVYRPGDTIHLNVMTWLKNDDLHIGHPFTVELHNPKNKIIHTATASINDMGLHSFHIPVGSEEMTGVHRVKMKLGPLQFSKNIRIETIKPNRLKIEIDAPQELAYYDESLRSVSVNSHWLHGADASELPVKVEAEFSNKKPFGNKMSDYVWLDPAREGYRGVMKIFDGTLDESGQQKLPITIKPEMFPGKVIAKLKTRVYEKGGNFSENHSTVNINTFSNYVGVKLPQNKWGRKVININDGGTVKIKCLNADGTSAKKRNLSVGIYDIQWRWWYYESNRHNIYKLNSKEHQKAIYRENITTKSDGTFDLPIDAEDIDWGRKLIRICDLESGHCTGDYFYMSGWQIPDNDQERQSLVRLNLKSEKSIYQVGDQVKVNIPSELGSKILLSLETGDEMIYQKWVEGQDGMTSYSFEADNIMAPNIYVHAMLLQSYNQKKNDLPVRMYGVIPISIVDKNTVIQPQVSAPSRIEPDSEFTVSVSEQAGKAMNYTIAIVDEGLLDLTNFDTPDPHSSFYAKRALRVRTWDVYNHVLTGFSGDVDQLISIGGDSEGETESGAKKAIRFKPVVMTAGPFRIGKGEKKEHHFTMPNYMGSVKTMIVAKENNSYGHTDQTSTVSAPLMIFPTVPRVVGPGDKVDFTVSVFATNDDIKKAKVSLETSSHFELIGGASRDVSFSKPSEELTQLSAVVHDQFGPAQLRFSTQSGRYDSYEEIDIEVRNPMPVETTVYFEGIKPGESWSPQLATIGIPSTNTASLQLSNVLNIDYDKRLRELIRYPYGCLEQTVSGAFPQLYMDRLISLSPDELTLRNKYIDAAITKVHRQQHRSGGFSYWPGGSSAHSWATSYAAHFLIEAQNAGFYVPRQMLQQWYKYSSARARSFVVNKGWSEGHVMRQLHIQAYRLMILALYGEPVQSAMNVLRHEAKLDVTSRFLLAAAYSYAGNKTAAMELIEGADVNVANYSDMSLTYGSALRDLALIGRVMITLEEHTEASLIVKKITDRLRQSSRFNTQEMSQCLSTLGLYFEAFERDELRADLRLRNGKSLALESDDPLFVYQFDPSSDVETPMTIKNNSTDVLFATIAISGQRHPRSALDVVATNRNISLDIKFTDLDGNEIDVSRLARGTDFVVEAHVNNLFRRGRQLDEMVWEFLLPSGWEILSGQSTGQSGGLQEDQYDYRDVRDDRVATFFDLQKKKTFRIRLTASYAGKYILPPSISEAMYDHEITAKTSGQRVTVYQP